MNIRILKRNAGLLLLGLLPFLTACPHTDEMEPPVQKTEYTPLFMTRSQLESSVLVQPPRNIHNAGKIYVYGSYLFINEPFEGVHIVNNADPRNPIQTGFIRIPGNVDLAVKGQVLYADNAVDLVAIDLSNPEQPQVTERIRNTFPELTPPDGLLSDFNRNELPENAILVGWQKKTNTK